MAVSLLNSRKGNISSASSGSTSGFTSTSGSTFVICVSDPNADLTVSDNKGNTYSQVGADQDVGGVTGQMWFCNGNAPSVGGAGHTATVTFNSGTGDCAFHFLEIGDSSAYDSASNARGTDTSSPFTITSGTFTQANNLVVAFAFNNDSAGNLSVGGPFSVASEESNSSLYWTNTVATAISSATTPLTPSFTIGSGGVSAAGMGLIIAAFRETGGAAPVDPGVIAGASTILGNPFFSFG